MTWARFIGVAVLALAFVVLPAACGGDDKTEPKKPIPSQSAKESDDPANPVSSKGKRWGGWRWKGKRDDCFFVYKNRCFSEKKKACQAAKCKKDACVMNKSAPAKISCKK